MTNIQLNGANITVQLPSVGVGLSSSVLRRGGFDEGFNNDPTETDATIAWPGWEPWVGTIAGVTKAWGFPERFKATHTSLIPKGPHQGKLVLWTTEPVVGKADITAGEWWGWQAWVILDLSPDAEIRCRNYILPVGRIIEVGPLTGFPSIFCSGHAWTEHGDLVVAGGNIWSNEYIAYTYNALWTWNPDHVGAAYITEAYASSSGGGHVDCNVGHYADSGAWVFAGETQRLRWYPTVRTTPRYAVAPYSDRTGVLVMGGSTVATPTVEDYLVQTSWNNYEAFVVTGSPTVSAAAETHDSGLLADMRNPATGASAPGVFDGPATTTPATNLSWYQETMIYYPHVHLLSDGRMYMSGMAARASVLADHENSPGVWTAGAGNELPASWPHERIYSSSVLAPNHDGVQDRVIRIGGTRLIDTVLTDTDSAQIIDASDNAATWQELPALNFQTWEQNMVVTPDADLHIFGGSDEYYDTVSQVSSVELITKPQRLEAEASGWGAAWELLTWSPAEAYRDYHSTAILLTDGRIFTGGGDGSTVAIDPSHPSHSHNPTASDHDGYDYEIFRPKYLRPRMETAASYPRPQGLTLTDATSGAYAFALTRGSTYTAQVAVGHHQAITHVVLMAPGSGTHHYDFCATYHKPAQSVVDSRTVQFTVPAADAVVLDGYHMLFALDSWGVPSEAIWVKVTTP